jgi:2-polyprenyl-3-methyl-5-hydroxy-6-metoxy-1,4-benzoquinol methylase
MKCRCCGAVLSNCFVDLGSAPPSNAYLTQEQMAEPEVWYPLKVMVCDQCWLVQTVDFAGRNEFFDANYAYFSSFSSTWLDHAKCYVDRMIERFSLNAESHVIEVAANDGYLLQFMKSYNIPCTGIEPTQSTAQAAREKGIYIVEDFFGNRLANELLTQAKQADLIIANNVLAHVPDINDFVSGFVVLLKPCGIATFEFPHLLNLVEKNQFDTIYHEHFSYLSLTVVNRIFKANGLSIFDVEELPTHGGSLRVFAQRSDTGKHASVPRVEQLLEKESRAGMCSMVYYTDFQSRIEKAKDDLLIFLLEAKCQGKRIAAYGAAAKGNTILNFAGVRPDLISFVVDKNPSKQGKCMPGSRIPITSEERLQIVKPNFVIILPWNLKEEVISQLDYIRSWGGKFVFFVPKLEIV